MDALIYAKWFHRLDIYDKTLINENELFENLNQDDDALPKFKGDYENEHMPSVINIMINTVFGFGQIPENEKEYATLIGQDQNQQYMIALILLGCVLVLVPVMLFVKPCCFRP